MDPFLSHVRKENQTERPVAKTNRLGWTNEKKVEVAVEHCGLCHSDLSVFNNEWYLAVPRDSRPRGHRSCHSCRSECKGTQHRTARRRRMVRE